MNSDAGAVMYPYFKMFPEWGEKECKIVKVNEGSGLPVGAYAFIDLYCTGKDCDCRRVMINVVDTSTLKHLVLTQKAYVERLKEHYRQVKEALADSRHAIHRRIPE